MTALEEYNRIAALYDEPGSRCKNHDFTIARAAIAELEADLAAAREALRRAFDDNEWEVGDFTHGLRSLRHNDEPTAARLPDHV